MIIASHYVMRDILRTLEQDPEGGKKVFEKYVARYSKDKELLDVYNLYLEYLTNKKEETLSKVKNMLKDLISSRKSGIMGSGSGTLLLKERRPGIDEWLSLR